MKLVKSLIAVGLSVAASAALAQPPSVGPQPAPGPTPSADTGNSGIIVSAWDATRGVSLVQYLGLRMDDMLPTDTSAAPEAGLLLDFGTLGGANGTGTSWSDVFGASDSANIQYEVSAFDFIQDAGRTFIGKRLETTAVAGFTSIKNTSFSASITNGRSFIASGLIQDDGTGPACDGGNPCVATTSGEPDYANTTSFGSKYGNQMPVNASSAVGSALAFYLVTTDNDAGLNTTADITQYKNSVNVAQWLLTSGGNLTYTLAAANVVPLPAAVWLLLSGLAGVGAIGRRRVAA
jgi:hypothetical protein